MKIRKLRKLKEWILAEPRRFDMTFWAGQINTILAQQPPCGTVGCLAGMACHMEGKKLVAGTGMTEDDLVISREAGWILGLSNVQASRLFYLDTLHGNAGGGTWPKRFENAYLKAGTLEEKAKIAAKRIDHFIKTDGRE